MGAVPDAKGITSGCCPSYKCGSGLSGRRPARGARAGEADASPARGRAWSAAGVNRSARRLLRSFLRCAVMREPWSAARRWPTTWCRTASSGRCGNGKASGMGSGWRAGSGRSCHNLYVDELRRNRTRGHEQEIAELADDLSFSAPAHDGTMAFEFVRAMDSLSVEHRQVLCWSDWRT